MATQHIKFSPKIKKPSKLGGVYQPAWDGLLKQEIMEPAAKTGGTVAESQIGWVLVNQWEQHKKAFGSGPLKGDQIAALNRCAEGLFWTVNALVEIAAPSGGKIKPDLNDVHKWASHKLHVLKKWWMTGAPESLGDMVNGLYYAGEVFVGESFGLDEKSAGVPGGQEIPAFTGWNDGLKHKIIFVADDDVAMDYKSPIANKVRDEWIGHRIHNDGPSCGDTVSRLNRCASGLCLIVKALEMSGVVNPAGPHLAQWTESKLSKLKAMWHPQSEILLPDAVSLLCAKEGGWFQLDKKSAEAINVLGNPKDFLTKHLLGDDMNGVDAPPDDVFAVSVSAFVSEALNAWGAVKAEAGVVSPDSLAKMDTEIFAYCDQMVADYKDGWDYAKVWDLFKDKLAVMKDAYEYEAGAYAPEGVAASPEGDVYAVFDKTKESSDAAKDGNGKMLDAAKPPPAQTDTLFVPSIRE